MQFVFWQNILSIHQSAFLRNLAESYSVTLVVEETLSIDRKKQGWIDPNFGDVNIVTKPNEDKLYELLDLKDSIHIFSGINSFPLITFAFRIAVKKKVKIGIVSEPFNWMGIKGKLRLVHYFLLRWRYDKYIDFILVIGNRGRWCYEKTKFSKFKIYDWGYFTENTYVDIYDKESNPKKIIFVGSIDERKNILSLVDACISISDKSLELIIIGTGPLEYILKNKIKNHSFIHFLGVKSNKEIPSYISNSDLLLLPSIFDGWGAVINEALMCGIPVIASDNCGASVLLKGNRGTVFSIKQNNLKAVLIEFIKQIPYRQVERQAIKNWTEKAISGHVAADYFEKIIYYVYENHEKRPIAPWIEK